MGVSPCGAQVLTTLGISRKPDSSAKTIWAPSRAAFFLCAASPFLSTVRSRLHPAPAHAFPVSAESSPGCASGGRYGPGDSGLRTHARPSRQCGPWSTDWFGNRSEEHTSELQSLRHLVCRLLLE